MCRTRLAETLFDIAYKIQAILVETLLKAVYGEDCLVLNIYRPSDVEASTPIMVWIHGGGMQAGSGMSVYTNATHLAKADFQTVSVGLRGCTCIGYTCIG